ncbi:retron St85 family RNA-directed DNA polymerase [Anaerovorax odorimutans]|uniref:retron St85 family RNA-directed DNA polymerase n=1 Tax=Anaerovorax odorimutans TaxID=109327 RepID=UPI00040F2C07|nr:retron St85 family RNA-directed DNA polymerase [Anaerovorax odorimutans]
MKKYINKTVLDSLNLPILTSFQDLVEQLRLTDKKVYWASSNHIIDKYNTFYIKKSNGNKRRIDEPKYSLKIIQRWVLENILYKIKVSPYSYGFKYTEGSPLVACSNKHRLNLFVLKMDLKDFYPSISKEKVYFQFLNIGYNTKVSNLLTNICTYNNSLPQGAVTSAYLANIVCRKMDYRIAGYCNKREIAYTRYADDLIFSSDNRELLHNTYGMIEKIITDEGFTLNKDKTTFMSPKNHKKVLGITINDNQVKAPKKLKREVRAKIHYQIATCDYSEQMKTKGYISYINSIEPNYKEKVTKYITGLSKSPLCLFPNVVKAYNDNKYFSELPNMILKSYGDFVQPSLIEEFEEHINSEYLKYLSEHSK